MLLLPMYNNGMMRREMRIDCQIFCLSVRALLDEISYLSNYLSSHLCYSLKISEIRLQPYLLLYKTNLIL